MAMSRLRAGASSPARVDGPGKLPVKQLAQPKTVFHSIEKDPRSTWIWPSQTSRHQMRGSDIQQERELHPRITQMSSDLSRRRLLLPTLLTSNMLTPRKTWKTSRRSGTQLSLAGSSTVSLADIFGVHFEEHSGNKFFWQSSNLIV